MARPFLLGVLVTLAFAQAPQDPVRDFCRRYGHQTGVIDRKLYIDGGWVYANPISQNPAPTINHGLLYGDLDRVNEFNFPEVHANLSKNNSIPAVSGGILWADQTNKVLWLFGGEVSTAPGPFQLWGYDVVLNQWNLSSAVSQASSTVQRVAYGAGTTNNDLGRGYYYGGYLNKNTNSLWSGAPYATNSLVVFDMDQNTLTNKTGPSDGIGRAEGVMVSIPASAAGMLVYFGGVKYPYGNSTEAPQSMDSIILYDIADEKWYTQKAIGQIPENRRRFCGGVAMAADKSSYNIYIYGGFGFGENATGFDDAYILTMPTFQWIKWYPDESGASNPHGLVSCNVIDNSQMIVMGGNSTANTDCDAPNVMGMHNLNLGQNDATNAKWYRFLPNVTSYIVPPAIVSAIGGSPSGGATKVSPLSGWSDSALQVYFKDNAQYQVRTPTRSLPAVTGRANDSSSDSRAPIGAIVGGAVGGLVLIIAAILFFCWRRRRHTRRRPEPTSTTTTASNVGPSSSVIARPELPGSSANNEKNNSITHVMHTPSSGPHSPSASPFSTTPLIPPLSAPVYTYHPGYPAHDSSIPQYHQHPYQQQHHPQYYHSHLRTSPHSPYPPYHLYPPTAAPYATTYPPPSDATSPPEGWIPHHSQQYFPPPPDFQHQRTSPVMQEMPTIYTPAPRHELITTHPPSATYMATNANTDADTSMTTTTSASASDSDRIIYYPAPIRGVPRPETANAKTNTSSPIHVSESASPPLIKRREIGGGVTSPDAVTMTTTDTNENATR